MRELEDVSDDVAGAGDVLPVQPLAGVAPAGYGGRYAPYGPGLDGPDHSR